MVDYRYVVSDANLGKNLAELENLAVGSFSRILSGCGALTATLPLDDPKATPANLDGDRELTVFRNDVPIWNGPITNLSANLQARQVTITAREANWYLAKRVLEVNSSTLFSGATDLFTIVRALVTYAKTKTSTAGDGTASPGLTLNAGIPRFSVSAGSAGVTKTLTSFAGARKSVQQWLDLLVADPSTGLDYRMDYATGSTRQACQRTLTLGNPLGVTQTELLTTAVLYDLTVEHDRESAANRVHGLGQGYTKTYQNTGSIAAGDILIEEVDDFTSLSDHTAVNSRTSDARRLRQPPVHTVAASHVPGSALPYGWCDLGDKVPFAVTGAGLLNVTGNYRVVQIDVTPPSGDTPEIVADTFNRPLDQLGA